MIRTLIQREKNSLNFEAATLCLSEVFLNTYFVKNKSCICVLLLFTKLMSDLLPQLVFPDLLYWHFQVNPTPMLGPKANNSHRLALIICNIIKSFALGRSHHFPCIYKWIFQFIHNNKAFYHLQEFGLLCWLDAFNNTVLLFFALKKHLKRVQDTTFLESSIGQ